MLILKDEREVIREIITEVMKAKNKHQRAKKTEL
jgi:hypothetical protein